MYTIAKQFEFSASHQLKDLCEGHPCMTMHGHNYKITLEMKSPTLNEAGMVLDYREMKVIKEYLDRHFDHQHLNTVLPFNATAENMSEYFFTAFTNMLGDRVHAVIVSETDKTWARYEKI